MKKWISYSILCLVIPGIIIGGAVLFDGRQYAWLSLCVAILSCIPFFLHFERADTDIKKLVLLAVMIAVSVVGRMAFSPVPGFKPVAAVTIITAMYFGGESGFMTGALTAVISNFSFGQGPWTPFQMLGFGMVGLFAGIFAEPLKRNRLLLAVYAFLAGPLYSMVVDISTVLWIDGHFHLSRYGAALLSSAGFTLMYAVSNVVFLLLLAAPVGKILERIKQKYGV